MRFVKVVASLIFAVVAAAPAVAAESYILIPGVQGDSGLVRRAGWSEVEGETLFVAPALADKGNKTVIRCSATVRGFLGAGAAGAISLVGSPLSGDVVIEMEATGADGVSEVVSRAVLGGAVIESLGRSFPQLAHDLQIRFSRIELTTWSLKANGSLGAPQGGSFDCTRP